MSTLLSSRVLKSTQLAGGFTLASLLAACSGQNIHVDITHNSSSAIMPNQSSMEIQSSMQASSYMSHSSMSSSSVMSEMHHSSDMTMSSVMGHNSSMDSYSSSSDGHHEFEAVINDFTGYTAWHLGDYSIGATHPMLGGAHQGDAGLSDEYMRKTFMNSLAYKSQHGSAEEFAVGSIIIKETYSYVLGEHDTQKVFAPTGGLLAMVKRGGAFNKENGGWEYFILEPDLKAVLAQGEAPAHQNCAGCHGAAGLANITGKDYVFMPMQYEIDTHLFGSYTQWDLIDYNTSPNELGGGAHIDDAQLRRTFQKQILAYPDATVKEEGEDQSAHYRYPVGTTLVKEITDNDKVAQIVAMVKRGAGFDSDGGDWEYFMLDTHNPSKVLINDDGAPIRGALAGCKGCHSKAMGDHGIDYIFKHSDAPFNNHNTKMQFIANNKTFKQYSHTGKEWTLVDYVLGNHNPFIGAAHAASEGEFQSDYVRAVFQNQKAHKTIAGEEYAMGSVIVKETFSTLSSVKTFAEPGGILAMVKRGGGYNPNHGGWEWIALDKTGHIAARSAMLKEGACSQCHSHGDDYTFAKPSEYIATIKDFQHFKTWTNIDDDKSLDSVHGGHSRITYKKQAHASPYVFNTGEYPVGTTFVKHVLNKDGSTNRLVAMVKRGGNYDPANNNWDWFILSNDGLKITSNSGSACTSCHGKAEGYGGMDYVYPHPNDPVRKPH